MRALQTRSRGSSRSCRRRPARSACTSAARPSTSARTSATRGRSSSGCGCAPGCAQRGYEVTLVHNITDVNDKIYDAAPGASAELAARATEWYLEDTADLGLGMPDELPKATEHDPGDRPLHRAARRRAATPTRSRATSTSASRATRTTAGSRVSGPTRSRSRSRTRSRRIRATSRSGRRTSRARTRPGTRRGAAAGRVGTSSARRWPRSASGRPSRSTAAGSTSSSRTTRTSSRSRARSATSSRASGCTTGCSSFGGEKMSKSLGNDVSLRNALDTWGREALLLFFLGAHWRKPIDFARRDARAGEGAGRDASATSSSSSPATSAGGDWEELAAALDDDFNTPEALALLHGWRDRELARCARARPLRARVARRAPRRRRRSSSALAEQRLEARDARDFAEADRLRDEIEAAGWEVRDVADAGFRLVRQLVTRELVYGRRPVREALRGPREVLELWATERAVRASRGCARSSGRGCRRSSSATCPRRAGHARPPGRRRLVRAVPLRRRVRARGRRSAAARLPRPGHRSAQPRRGHPQRRRGRRERSGRARARLGAS